MFVIPDKSRSLYPVNVTFTSGEIPTAEKLSAISTQARRGLNIVEYILGDTWNQGGDAFLAAVGATTYALMIPNIARYLGKTNNLNPRVPYTTSVTSYNHLVTASEVGKRELTLSLPPTALTSFTWAGTSAPSGAPQTSKGNVDSSGEWFVDRDTGWCYFYDLVQSDWNVTYAPQVEGDLGEDATWNVIPDINRDTSYAFGGCKIAYKNGVDNSEGYIIYLPPRGPLDSDREIDRSPHSHSDNFSATPGSLPVKFWQDESVGATTGTYAEHYRYALPKIITDNYSNGATLPQGMIYLWDHSQTGTIIEGLTFTAEDVASPRSYVLIASGTALDSWVTNYFSTAYPSANLTHSGDTAAYHTSAYYPSAGLKVITVGSDITATLSNLIKMFYNHDHGSANSLPGNVVSHQKLGKTFSPIVSQVSASVRLPLSAWSYDDHPQYMHRFGSSSGTAYRDIHRGGMLGDLLLCSSNSTSDYLNLVGASRKLRFGNIDGTGTEPYLNYSIVDDDEEVMDSLHLNYKKVTIGSPDGAAIEFRTVDASWSIDEAARIHHTSGSEPIVSIERADKTEGWGEGASLKVGRIYAGSNDDADYGYNSYNYGPVRYYRIPATRWYLYEVSSTSDGSSLIIPPSAAWSIGGSHLLGYDYETAKGFETFTTLIPTDGGSATNVALYIVDLPFLQYGVVGFRMSVKTNSATIPASAWYVRWGAYKHDKTVGGNGFQNLNYGETNLYNIWGSAPGGLSTTGTTWQDIFVDTGDPSLDMKMTAKTSSSSNFDDNKQIYIMVSVLAVSARLEIAGAELVYRIKEF